MKDLKAKNTNLAQRLEENLHYRDAKAKAAEAEKRRVEIEGQLGKSNDYVEWLRKELHEMKCQVAAFTEWLDHANEYHCLVTEALEALNKEKLELRYQAEAQVEEIESLKAEVKVVGETAV